MDEKRTDYEPNFIMKDSPISPSDDQTTEQMRADQIRSERPEQVQPDQADNVYQSRDTQPTYGFSQRYVSPSSSAYWQNENTEQTHASATWTASGHTSNRGFETGRAAREKRKKEKKPSPPVTLTRRTLGFLVAGCLVLSAFFGLGGAFVGNNLWNDDVVSAPVATTSSSGTETTGYDLQDATGSKMTVKEITEATQGSVVEIKTESASGDSWLQDYVTEGAGSGVIISKDGYIMTNNHVISGANKITVTTADDKSYEAKLVGTDSTNDVAVIKIKANNLKPVTFGNSDQLQVGDLAVAIGNPLGELGGTVTAGIISATDRQLNIDGTTMTLLQTDSSINPGNSGGGLFNGDGQLVGLVVAKSSGSDVEGLGFAIPVNKAADVANQLMDKGYVSNQPFTGMTYTEGSSGFDSFFGETSGGTVYIYSVDSTTAKLAGFKAGDIVYAIDGKEISSIDDVSGIITSHKVGDKVTFTVLRDGQAKDIKLKLQEKTKAQQEQQNSQN